MTVFIGEELRTYIESLPVVRSVTTPTSPDNKNVYYGMNVSPNPSMEPLDQLDGFLVARIIQDKIGSSFYPFIAGTFEVFNAKSAKEARTTARRKVMNESNKKRQLENVMEALELKGKIYTTNDLWGTDDYWSLFEQVIRDVGREAIESRIPQSRRTDMTMKDFPLSVLGNYTNNINGCEVSDWPANLMYIPAEVAEALWFGKNCGVGFKTGPVESESIYDDIITDYGFGIIGLEQPEYFGGVTNNGEELIGPRKGKATPYIGKKGQNRVLFSDSLVDLTMIRNTGENPSYERALDLCETYEIATRSKTAAMLPVYRILKLINLAKAGGS